MKLPPIVSVKLQFPTMLRKMWSGGDVQSWLDRQGPLFDQAAVDQLARRVADADLKLAKADYAYDSSMNEVKRLVRELDVLLNGEAGAAPQASLCDIVGQVASVVRERGAPLLTPLEPVAWQHRCVCEECQEADWQECTHKEYLAALDDPQTEGRQLFAQGGAA